MYQLSLISGVLPWLIGTTGFAAFAVVLTKWPRRAWWTVPITFLAAVGLLAGISYGWQLPEKLHGTWPRSFFVWSACPVVAAAAGIVTWRRGRLAHHAISLLAVVLLTAFAADRVNIYYGALPTIGDALGAPLPGEISHTAPLLERTATRTRLPASGVVFPLPIMGLVSHFHARASYVWLPPIWFSRPRPRLPALELVAGAPSFTGDWLRGGGALRTLDAYARTHHGWGPIVVVADQNGSFLGDTECVDGPRGRADTYISVDVVRTIDRLFNVAAGPESWAIAGYSAGGTCALVTALRHPNLYGAFGDFSGDPAPNAGPWSTTLHDLFGGSLTLAQQYDPTRLLRSRRYPTLLAWFETGLDDTASRRSGMQTLASLARRAGAHVVFLAPAGSHTFYFWQHCLQIALPAFIEATARRPTLTEVDADPSHPTPVTEIPPAPEPVLHWTIT